MDFVLIPDREYSPLSSLQLPSELNTVITSKNIILSNQKDENLLHYQTS